jgi:hypothetical protein
MLLGEMKSTYLKFKFLAGVLTLALIVACGGGGSTAGHSFPLTSSVTIRGVNSDGTNIHFVMNAEPYDPSNRVTANTTADRASTFTLKWDNASDIRAISVFAGRNGANLAGPISVTMTGDDRMQGKYILATWDGTNLTADLAP